MNIEDKYKMVRRALADIVGSDDLKELGGMLGYIQMLPDEIDTKSTVNAVKVLIATHEDIV